MKTLLRLGALAVVAASACACSANTVSGTGRDAGRGGDAGRTGGDGGIIDRSADTDGDTISDGDEGVGTADSDHDGTPDVMDLDSDGDGYTDAEEAGDTELATPPVDSDLDGQPDFRDIDSDNDGLSDADERTHGTSRTNPDTDGDGVSDLVEVTAGTDPTSPTSNPRAMGDFYFLEPYMADPSPPRDTLVFATTLQRADVFFMIDTSISMQAYIDTIRSSLSARIIPGIAAAVPDVQFGVGQFDHCPQSTYDTGTAGTCRGIEVNQASTSDIPAVTTALGTLTADCRPVAEPYAQAAWVWATGDTARWPLMAARACAAGTVGYGCQRGDALPILVIVGDERFSESYRTGGTDCSGMMCTSCAMFPSSAEMTAALAAIRARLVVLGPTGTSAQWAPIVTASGAIDAAGAPLIFPSAGSATVDAAVIDGIVQLAANTPLDISARARDVDDGDGVDATVFIDHIEANVVGGVADPRDMTRVCVGGLPATDTNGDGFLDTFTDVRPGTPVCFDIVVRRNTTVMPTALPQLFRANIDVIGDGITVLDTRQVFFLVPPTLLGPG